MKSKTNLVIIRGRQYVAPDPKDSNDLISDEFKAFMDGNPIPPRKNGMTPWIIDLNNVIQDLKVVFSLCDQGQKQAIAWTIRAYKEVALSKLGQDR
ncbi:MAG: hypothetical protein WCJ37_02510 [Syntrophus sp. (in: bacteria)]